MGEKISQRDAGKCSAAGLTVDRQSELLQAGRDPQGPADKPTWDGSDPSVRGWHASDDFTVGHLEEMPSQEKSISISKIGQQPRLFALL